MNDNGFSSMDELIDLLTRGGEIEFVFHSRQYSLLPNIGSILSKLIETGAIQ